MMHRTLGRRVTERSHPLEMEDMRILFQEVSQISWNDELHKLGDDIWQQNEELARQRLQKLFESVKDTQRSVSAESDKLKDGSVESAEQLVRILLNIPLPDYKRLIKRKNEDGNNGLQIALLRLWSEKNPNFRAFLNNFRYHYDSQGKKNESEITKLLMLKKPDVIESLQQLSICVHHQCGGALCIECTPPSGDDTASYRKEILMESHGLTTDMLQAIDTGMNQSHSFLLKTAKRGEWSNMEIVAKSLPQCENMHQVLREMLEVDRSNQSIMQRMLKQNQGALLVLGSLLTNPVCVKDLKETLMSSYWMMRFQYLEMPLQAIWTFEEPHKAIESIKGTPQAAPPSRLCKKRYIIPKPSKLSRPLVMIFYNQFKEKGEHIETEKEAKALEKSFVALNWPKGSIKIQKPEWKFKEMKEQIHNQLFPTVKDDETTELPDEDDTDSTNCSLLIICIASHGYAGRISGRHRTVGKISEILDHVSKLPPWIPKVVIADVCRDTKWWIREKISYVTRQNILLLQGTVHGKSANVMSYCKFLAKEITEGNDTLQNMHSRASCECMPHGQIAELQSTAKEIFLRKFCDINKCQKPECEESGLSQKGGSIPCANCLCRYHTGCAGLKEDPEIDKPGVHWFCQSCDRRLMGL